tara:strand:+ start:410 stop:1276 length:867 start_codon:yes stop_codon:yes gene_type:complete
MPIDPEKLLEITKKSQVEYFKNEIPITNDGKKRYTCANPEGPVDNNGCPSDDPYCNCPEEIKTLQPKDAFLVETNQAVTNEDFPRRNVTFNVINSDGEDLDEFESRQDALDFIEELDPAPEPTDEELEELLQKSKYCKLIEEGGTGSEEPLGEEYLGCDWQDPDSNFSCICPEVGSKYKDWKKYYETYSTFWNTPKQTPLLRNAQMTLLTAQKAKAIVHGDFSIRPGAIINLEISNINNDNSLKSSSGKWMVAEIEHSIFGANAHTMTLTLIRDSLYVDANSSQSVES